MKSAIFLTSEQQETNFTQNTGNKKDDHLP
jgi:hypothetical protein